MIILSSMSKENAAPMATIAGVKNMLSETHSSQSTNISNPSPDATPFSSSSDHFLGTFSGFSGWIWQQKSR